MTPGQRGREIGGWMIALAGVPIGLTIMVFIAALGTSSLMFNHPPDFFGLPVGALASWTGVIGVIVGLVWMIRIHRADPEPDQHAWRYRAHRRKPSGRAGMTSGQRGRVIGRWMIAIACLAVGGAGFLYLARPGGATPLSAYLPRFGPVPVDLLLLLIGVTGVVLGLVWIIRIHRADPEPDQRAWRYRANDR